MSSASLGTHFPIQAEMLVRPEHIAEPVSQQSAKPKVSLREMRILRQCRAKCVGSALVFPEPDIRHAEQEVGHRDVKGP